MKTYNVKEVFLTLQGEGVNTGRAAVFVRFSGCNLWSGREEDRGSGRGGCSAWCDTDFIGGDRLGLAELAARIASAARSSTNGHLVVFTGGEPLLQLDEKLISEMHSRGFVVAVETNGTIYPPPGIDWLCVSPKLGAELLAVSGNELKLVYPQPGAEPELYAHLSFNHFILQPMDGLCRASNARAAAAYCMRNPKWRLGIQMHKSIGVP